MISILMATYNGAHYVSEQIESLLSQTVKDFTLWISDDASNDSTWDILTHYANQHPNKIKISKRDKNSGSSWRNFLELMVNIKDDYVMLCDQDDVWLPNKIERTLAKMKATEQRCPDTPILIRTDQYVVDQNLQMISPSYMQLMHSDYNRTAFHQVLIQNTFAGCTAMYNRKLAYLLDKIPDYCIMHDWWLELVAAAFGVIDHIDDATMLYRQHGKNVIGVRNVHSLAYKFDRLIHHNEVKEAIKSTYVQAKNFLQCYENKMAKEQQEIARRFCAIPETRKLSRWWTICSLGAYKNGFSRNVAYFLFV